MVYVLYDVQSVSEPMFSYKYLFYITIVINNSV